jgi:hypothetical protein
MPIGAEYSARRLLPTVSILTISGYAGVPINPNTTSVSFIPRGEMDGEAKLELLVNVSDLINQS